MPDTVAAELIAEFKSKNVSGILDDYRKVHAATKDLGEAMDRVHDKRHTFWATFNAPTGALDDLKKVHTHLSDIHGLLGKTAPTTFGHSLHGQITQAETAWDRFTDKVKNWRPNLNFGGGGGGGGGGFNPASLLGGPLGVVGDVAGMAGSAVGGVAGIVTGGAGAVGSFAVGQAGAGISDLADIDAARASIAAHMGTDFNLKNKAGQDAILSTILQNAYGMSIDPSLGALNTTDALGAMDVAAKNNITDPAAMQEAATNALKLRSAGGADRITPDQAMKLILTSQNAFGGKYSQTEVSNAIVGLVNGTTLDINEIQGIMKNAGSAVAAGMPLDQYMLEAGMMAQAGVPAGQIGVGIKQILQMSQPKTKPAMDAMAALGLVTKGTTTITKQGKDAWEEWVPDHMEDVPDKATGTYLLNGQALGSADATPGEKTFHQELIKGHTVYHKGTQATTHEVENVLDNKLWDAQGNIADPETFFAKILKGTQDMTPEQRSDLIGKAFNPKAAGYIEQLLGYYQDNPDAFDKLAAQMKAQGDAAATAKTQNDNLKNSFQQFGDTLQALRSIALTPLLAPLKEVLGDVNNLGSAIFKGAQTGDWSKLVPSVDRLKADVLGKLKEVGAWLQGPEPKKILAGVGTMGFDIVTVLFGADVATKVSTFISTTVPGLISGVKDFGKGAGSLWEQLKPLLFGTPAERTAAIDAVTGAIGGALGTFLQTDLPKLFDANQNAILGIGTRIGEGLVAGFWAGFQGSDMGKMAAALASGDFKTVADLLGKHEGAPAGGGAGGQTPDKKSGSDYYSDLWQDVQKGDWAKFADDWGKAKGVDNGTGNPLIAQGDLNSVGLGGIATGYEGQVPLVRTGMGPNDLQPASPPPGYSWADGRYDHSAGKWVWIPTDPTRRPGGAPVPPPPASGVGYNGTYSPQIIVQSYPGDPNTYKVKPTPPPSVAQRHSQDLENYGRSTRPRS